MHSTKTAGDRRLYFQGIRKSGLQLNHGLPAISDCNHRPCDIDLEKGALNTNESERLPREQLS